MPSTLVYLEALPSWIALIAAFLLLAVLSQPGLPAPCPTPLRPASLSARALSVTAMVADGLMRLSESARKAMSVSPVAPGSLGGGCRAISYWLHPSPARVG